MNPLKRLASQTAVYGLSSILGRFLNYLLVPLYTYTFVPADYGVVAEFYAYMGFLAVLMTFGMETGYFRFRSAGEDDPNTVLATVLRFLILANGGFLALAVVFQQPVAELLRHGDHPEYIWWMAGILAMDSVGNAAFARLRAEERALRFATIKLIEIGANIGLNVFFIVICRQAFEADPGSFLGRLWVPEIGIGYVFISNLAASGLKLLLLTPQFRGALTGFDGALFRRMLRYSLPMVIIGMAGIVNEMLDRAALKFLLPYDDATNMAQLGIYSAVFKLSILMMLFIQAFRYAGEPFFFSYAKQRDAKEIYALVLTWFVIFCVFIFLLVTLFIDGFQYFIGEAYREGLHVVPVLLLANLLLGVYVNLSIWYKLTDRTLMGAWVALTGAGITIVSLWLLVPTFGYEGAAWAHLICYSAMVVLSYGLGRRYYPVPYEVLRVFGYIALGLGLFAAGRWLTDELAWHPFVAGSLLLALYLLLVAVLDGRRLLKAPDSRRRREMKTRRTPRAQATMRQAPSRGPAVGWRPSLRHIDLALAAAATLMAVVSLVLDDVAKAPLYALLAYLLWRLRDRRQERAEPERRDSTRRPPSHARPIANAGSDSATSQAKVETVAAQTDRRR